jgi:hypothetical protein
MAQERLLYQLNLGGTFDEPGVGPLLETLAERVEALEREAR